MTTKIYIVYMEENAYERSDYIDSVWDNEEDAIKRASSFPELKPPYYDGYIGIVEAFDLNSICAGKQIYAQK